MQIPFVKYQGTGNDFVMIDNMKGEFDNLTISQIQFLCDRKLGIGADGLIKLSKHPSFDFEVEYFNADGSQSFCGNGARCSVAFAHSLGIIDSETSFWAIDGKHLASIKDGIVRLEMLPVKGIESIGDDFFVDTGSPHYVRYRQESDTDIISFGKEIRYSKQYEKEGVNVNYLIEKLKGEVAVETYERGVEDETLSCGTGVTGVALVYMYHSFPDLTSVSIETKGGELFVEAQRSGDGFDNIWLSGPATHVFNGTINV